ARLSPSLLGRFGRALAAWAGEERDANIEELALSAGVSQRAASSLVTTLVEAGICERVEDRRVHPTVPLDELVERVEGLRSRFEVLRREDARRMRAIVEYANESECRSRARRRYFGDMDPTPCGRCDLCRAQGVGMRPAGRHDHRPRRPRRPWQAPGGEGPRPEMTAAQPVPGPRPDGHERRRRRRRRGRRGARPDVQAGTMPGNSLTAPPPVVVSPLPPLDPAADDLAAELGAPGLPPE